MSLKVERVATSPAGSFIRRLTHAFVGLLAGDAALLLLLLFNAIRIRAALISAHMGNPGREIRRALQMFALYVVASLVGWLVVGLPIAGFLPARVLVRLEWPVRLFIGAVLGPLALLMVLFLLARGHLIWPDSFRATGMLWLCATIVSSVAFPVYVALLRRGFPKADQGTL